MTRDDFERHPCDCGECRQAGVSDRPQRRDPQRGDWMHGYRLKGYYDSRADFLARVQAIDARKAAG